MIDCKVLIRQRPRRCFAAAASGSGGKVRKCVIAVWRVCLFKLWQLCLFKLRTDHALYTLTDTVINTAFTLNVDRQVRAYTMHYYYYYP